MSIPENLMPLARPIEVLLVEDDDDDVLLTKKSLQKDRVLSRVHRVEDGVEAMKFLHRENEFADAVRPDLILLDLNMPLKDGREVLREINEDENLRVIPVIVLTTSDDEADVLESYHYHANSYVTKPFDLLQFRKVLETLKDYWFSVVKLPPSDSN